jgi:transcriptional regulator with XRE-family HTH domain
VTRDRITGELIRFRREQVGLSRRALSLEAGLSESYVSKIEAGRLQPTLESFARIARVLRFTDLQIAWIVRMQGVPPP